MFTFLNSIILSALAMALIPLLIHLFNKQKTKKIKFSSLRFLKKLEKRRLKKVKIYQILLIIIRTLLIILLVLAFARPTFSGAWSILQEPSANTTAVVILDDGLNMRQYDSSGNRFNRALAKLSQVLKSFKPEDRIQLLKTSSSEIDILDSLDIQLQECSYLISDINSNLIQAVKYFNENPNINKEIHIISDMETMTEQMEEFALNYEDVRIYLERIKEQGIGNISVDNLVFENTLFEINKPLKAKLYLRNHSTTESMTVNTHMFINEKRVAQNNSTILANEQKIVHLTFIPKSYGWNIGYIEINDDDLLADNKYYFSIKIPEKAKVLMVDSNPSPYLESAIETINKSANIEIIKENYNSLARQSFFDYNVIFLSNVPEISNVIASRLKLFMNSGGGIILVPGDKTVPSYFNASLSSMFGNLKIINLKKSENSSGYYTLKKIRQNNPILSEIFRKENPEISLPKFKKYFKLANTNNYQNIMQLNDGNPFLLFSDKDNLNVLVLSSYFDDSWSDLHFKGIFIPLLIKMIKYAAFNLDKLGKQIIIGDNTVINISNRRTKELYELLAPEGEKNRITPVFSGSNTTFDLNDFSKPGNYKIQQSSITHSVISVNVDSKKLGVNRIDIEKIVSDNDNIELISENESVNEKVKEARFGEEFWKYIIGIAVLILLFESFVVKKIEGRI